MPELTPTQIKEITKRYFNECLERFEAYKARHEGNRWGLPSSDYEHRPDGLSIEQAVAEIIAPFVTNENHINSGEYMFEMNDHAIESQSIEGIDRESNSYKMLASGMRRVHEEFKHQVRQHANAELEPTINDAWFNAESTAQATLSTPSVQAIETVSEPISVVYGRYLNEMRSTVTPKTLGKKEKALRTWLDLMEDTQMHAVTKPKAREFKEYLMRIPVNATQRYPETPLRELLDANAEKLSNKSVNNYLTDMGSFFKWAIANGYYGSDNPFTGLQLALSNNTQTEREPFSPDQLVKLFTSPIYKGCKSKGRRYITGEVCIKDKLYWIPLIGLYSGMRLGEICQLTISDIHQEHGVWVFNINRDAPYKTLKNEQSKRLVPVHNQLLSMGLLDYLSKVSQRGCERLFEDVSLASDGTLSSTFSKQFTRALKVLDVKTDKTCFHSFRHNFTDVLRNTDIEDKNMKALLGHMDGTTTFRYGSQTAVTTLKREMDKVSYSNVEEVL